MLLCKADIDSWLMVVFLLTLYIIYTAESVHELLDFYLILLYIAQISLSNRTELNPELDLPLDLIASQNWYNVE